MELSKLAKIFKALSCEQRLRVLQLIRTHEEYESQCSGLDKAFTKACDLLNISRSTISHHFKELENAGLISCSRNGQSVCCRLNKEALEALHEFLPKP